MKKIYMILAAITLLSMSLNAQTTIYQKVTSQSDLTNGEYLIVNETNANSPRAFDGSLSTLDARGNYISVTISDNTIQSSATVDAATFTFDFTAGTIMSASGIYIGRTTNSSNGISTSTNPDLTNTVTVDETTTAVEIVGTSGGHLRYNQSDEWFRYYKSNTYTSQKEIRLYKKVTSTATPTLSVSTTSLSIANGATTGTFTVTGTNLTDNVTITATNGFTVNPASITATNGSVNQTTITVTAPSDATSTTTGVITIASDGATSQTVNVTYTPNGGSTPSGNELTVPEGATAYIGELPVYGLWYDSSTGQHNQMIYPSSMLTDMVGKTITSLTFYTYGNLRFYDGNVQLSLGTTGSTTFSSAAALTDNVTVSGSIVPVASTGDTEWTIELSTPYTYNGGNLLVDVVTETGEYGGSSTYFYAKDMSSNVGFYSYYYYGSTDNNLTTYLPKVTFTYEDNNKTAKPTIAGAVDPNNENNFVITATGNGTVTLTANGQTVTGNGSASITVPRTDVDQTVTATATAQETGKEVSDPTNETITVPKLQTADPVITSVVNGDNVVITATGNGTVTLTVGNQTETGNGSASITVPRTGVDQTVTATATAQETGKAVSNTVSEEITVPELPIPVLTSPVDDSSVNVGTNSGSGVSKTINIKGKYLTQDLTVTVSGTGFSVSRDVNVTAADANSANGQDIIVTYNGTNENATGTLTISSSEVSATVHLTASYAEDGDLTVAEGTGTNEYLPIYGYYYDNKQINQVIYPSSMLTDMQGKYITSVTFYSPHLYFSGGKYTVQVGETSQSSFSSAARNTADLSATVATDLAATAGGTTMTITFDTPFLYNGGNLLMDFEVTETGAYGGYNNRTSFYGTTRSGAGFHSYGSSTNSNGVYNTSNGVDNFLPKATFTYSSTAPLPPAVEGGLLRLHLLFCDQLKAAIPDDNSHPDAYGYVLRWEPQGEDMKESGRVKVNIQKTDCEVLGYYTLDQIDLDKHIGSYDETTGTIKHDQGLTMDVITAQVEFDLSSSNDMLNYYYLQGKEAGYPSPDEFLSQLHRQEDFTYREMWPDAPEFDEVYDSGVHHYFDDSTPIKTGTYGSNTRFMSYAPSVTTWGIQRRYFELDGKDNTYGAPVWKTSVGMVTLDDNYGDVTLKAERQTNANNSVNWTGPDGKAASVYILDGINAVGKLPHTDKTKVKFEPYMFRVFVESKSGKLRPYKFVEADPTNTTQPGEHFEAADGNLTDADMYGPICVWSGYIKYETDQNGNKVIVDVPEDGVSVETPVVEGQTNYVYHKYKVDRPSTTTTVTDPETGETTTVLVPWNLDENNAMFGALDEVAISGYDNNGQPILNGQIDPDDLKVFVRFYYNVKGMADGHVIMGRAGEATRPGNGSESPGYAPAPWTAVKEVVYNGEVVSRTYVNTLGMQSDEPFEGVNIVVTRYSDGKTSTTKVIR